MGSKTFSVETGLALSTGQQINIVINNSNKMEGTITSYNPTNGTLNVNVTSITGSGTYPDGFSGNWMISLSGAPGPKGDTGWTGPTGAQGVQGDIGPTGPQGNAGAPMGSGNLNGPYPGNNSGNNPAAFLMYYYPNQQVGTSVLNTATGDIWYWTGTSWNMGSNIKGPTGPQGSQGSQGIQGNIGPTGLQGSKGDTGFTGHTGAQGAQGVQGDIGPAGIQGSKGDTGFTGPTGAQGIQGNIGPTGPQGTAGDSAWKIFDMGFDYDSYDINGIGQVNITNCIVTIPSCALMDNTSNTFGSANVSIRLVVLQEYGGAANMFYDLLAYSGGAPTIYNTAPLTQFTTNGPNNSATEHIIGNWFTHNISAQGTTFQLRASRTAAGSTRIKKVYLQIRKN